MGRYKQRRDIGGIISLADFAESHHKALEYDLLTRTGYTLDDVGGRLSWSALSSFIYNLQSDSATYRDLGKTTGWEDTIKTNFILADIYDLLQVINANIIGLGGNKHRKINPYPRPNDKDKDDVKKIGKGALPYEKLKEWFKERRNGRGL